MSELQCEVCEKEPMVGVAAVPGVPYSAAYGRACLEANAHPYWLVVANTALVGGYHHSSPWWQQMVDDTLSHLDVTRQRFDEEVAERMRDLEDTDRE